MAYSAALLIIALNAWLVVQALGLTRVLTSSGGHPIVGGLGALLCGMLLGWITFSPLRLKPLHTTSPRKAESMLYQYPDDSMRVASVGTPSLL